VSTRRDRGPFDSEGLEAQPEGFYTPRPAMTPSASALRAMAQLDEILACLPFAARLALSSACLSAFLAFLRSFRASFAGLPAA
jgi:hypothetical protein